MGTAFFLTLKARTGQRAYYVVTAKHVIEGIAKHSKQVYLSLNNKNGKRDWLGIDFDKWKNHPKEPAVDVAVARMDFEEHHDHLAFEVPNEGIHSSVLKKVSVGEPVISVGLFVPRIGESKNIPVIRFGKIAAMPEEKINTDLGYVDAYLLDMPALSGVSGAPIFIKQPGRGLFAGQYDYFYLLGINHGKYDQHADVIAKKTTDDVIGSVGVNTGISIAEPTKKIMEVLASLSSQLSD